MNESNSEMQRKADLALIQSQVSSLEVAYLQLRADALLDAWHILASRYDV